MATRDKSSLDSKEIAQGFNQLRLTEKVSHPQPYRGAKEFSQNFERCTIFQHSPVQYSSGTVSETFPNK